MLRRTTAARIALPVTAFLAASLALPALTATADATPAEDCVQAGNVWVHVEYDETVTGACATEFASAQDAVLSSGVTTDVAWIQTVDGRLAENQEWWSVYYLSPTTDGTYPSEWEFAQVGVGELELAASDVLALKLQDDWELDSVAPSNNPVATVTLVDDEETPVSPSPSPSATAAPEPVVTQSPAVTPSPSATAEPTVAAEPTVEVTVTPSAPNSAASAPAQPGLPKTGH